MTKETKIKLKGAATPDWYLSLESEVIEVLALEAQVKARKEKLQTTILTMMESDGIDAIETDLTSSSRRKPYESSRFDSARFKDERPDDYKAYCKTISVSASVTLKWLKQPNGEHK